MRIADDDEHLQAIFELDAATNDRLLAEHQRFPGIGVEELVFGVPCSHVVNAAFCHPHPLGRRFSGPDRGAWYAGVRARDRRRPKSRSTRASSWPKPAGRTKSRSPTTTTSSDVSAAFHDLRRRRRFHGCLDPASYVASQALAERLLDAGSLGVVYPSVRHAGGTCVACFRPALVTNVRKDATHRLTIARDGTIAWTRK